MRLSHSVLLFFSLLLPLAAWGQSQTTIVYTYDEGGNRTGRDSIPVSTQPDPSEHCSAYVAAYADAGHGNHLAEEFKAANHNNPGGDFRILEAVSKDAKFVSRMQDSAKIIRYIDNFGINIENGFYEAEKYGEEYALKVWKFDRNPIDGYDRNKSYNDNISVLRGSILSLFLPISTIPVENNNSHILFPETSETAVSIL